MWARLQHNVNEMGPFNRNAATAVTVATLLGTTFPTASIPPPFPLQALGAASICSTHCSSQGAWQVLRAVLHLPEFGPLSKGRGAGGHGRDAGQSGRDAG